MITAVINAKGGVGKSTIAVHNCDWLTLHGYSCVLVDCDSNQSSSDYLNAARPKIPAVQIDEADEALEQIPKLADKYEAVVIDAPGGLHAITGAVLTVTDAVLIPTGASNLDIMGLDWTVETIQQIQELRGGFPMTAIVPSKIVQGTKVAKKMERVAESLHFGITQSVLHQRTIFQEAAGERNIETKEWAVLPRLVWDMGKSKYVRTAALEMDSLFQEVFNSVCQEDRDVVRRLVTPKNKLRNSQQEEYDHRSVANY